tara:strand:+ start:113 stop:814 length:702 start_codon:yes stop_codon:yes gene_type:complete
MSKNTTQYGFKSSKKIKEHYTDGIQQVLNNIQPIFDITTLGASFLQIIITSVIIFLIIKNAIINICFPAISNPAIPNPAISNPTIPNPRKINADLKKYFVVLKNDYNTIPIFIIPLILALYINGLFNQSYNLYSKSQDIINFSIFVIFFLIADYFNVKTPLNVNGEIFIALGSFCYIAFIISKIIVIILKIIPNLSNKDDVIKYINNTNIPNTILISSSLIFFILFFIFKNIK